MVAVRKRHKAPKLKKTKAKKAIPKAAKRAKAARIAPKKAASAARTPSGKAVKAAKSKRPAPPPVRKPDEGEQLLLQKIGKILGDSCVRQNLIEIGGENALAIVRNFYGNHSDEELAKKLKIKISDVRATLNKLHNEGLVNYIREKDSETGWYSYSWSLNHQRMEKWASSQANRLNTICGESGDEYYFCTACGAATITNFESAATVEFRCERCNRLLEFIDERRMAELFEKNKA